MKSILLTVCTLLGCFIQGFSAVIFVNTQATGNNDGSSWANAFTNLSQAIQHAANNASNADSLFVAEGIYVPDVDNQLGFPVFNCPPQIALFGGFPSSGNPEFEDRDWQAHLTVLNGDVLGDDDNTSMTRVDNARRVLVFDTFGRLDGFVVRNGGDDSGGVGAGLTLNGTTSRGAQITNCLFENNWVTSGGALVGDGGAIRAGAVNATDVVDLQNVLFRNNRAKFGAALIYGGTAELNNCVFIENEAELGSAIAVSGSSAGAGPATIINSVFYNNTSVAGTNQGDRSGTIGRLNAGTGDLTVLNSTFKDNNADTLATVYSGIPLSVSASTVFNNCLIDELSNVPAFGLFESDTINMNNCVGSFSAGWGANASIGANDGLIVLSNWKEGEPITYITEDNTLGVFILDCDAPGYNDGLNDLLPGSLVSGSDILGNARVQGGTVDVGAYETSTFDRPMIEQQGSVLQVTNGSYDNYQWVMDGSPVSGGNDSTLSLSENGTYWLVASNDEACGVDTSAAVEVTDQNGTGTGIKEYAFVQVRVWPNPTSDVLHLRSESTIYNVFIYNTAGEKVIAQPYASDQIDLKSLAPGVYFVEAQFASGSSVHRVLKH